MSDLEATEKPSKEYNNERTLVTKVLSAPRTLSSHGIVSFLAMAFILYFSLFVKQMYKSRTIVLLLYLQMCISEMHRVTYVQYS